MLKIEIEENGSKGRFVIYEESIEAGEMTFTWAGKDKFIIDHTYIGKEYGGKGYGKKLLSEAINYARKKEVRILPLCPFAKAMFERDNSTHDVLA